MTKEELYLKTIFCCIACDGDIATEEVDMVKDLCAKDNIFHDVDSEKYLNSWITEINEQGGMFLQSYLTLNPQLHSRSATYIKRNGLLIRKTAIMSSRPFHCAYHPLTP